jgi:hypothetical protein
MISICGSPYLEVSIPSRDTVVYLPVTSVPTKILQSKDRFRFCANVDDLLHIIDIEPIEIKR